MNEADEKQAEQIAWEWFAEAHPHEAHAMSPDRFWEFFQTKCPGVSRETMVATLKETDRPCVTAS